MDAVKRPKLRNWTRQEYDQMIAAGVIRSGERVELIDGEIRSMAAQGSAHLTAVRLTAKALEQALGTGYEVRTQAPIALDDRSEPEPDVAVAPGSTRDYRKQHPTQVLLVVEVSDSTLREDRRDKGSLYARGGIQDYWIVNLVKGLLEVYREPVPAPEAPCGWKYRLVERYGPEDTISPLARQKAKVQVADLLP